MNFIKNKVEFYTIRNTGIGKQKYESPQGVIQPIIVGGLEILASIFKGLKIQIKGGPKI